MRNIELDNAQVTDMLETLVCNSFDSIIITQAEGADSRYTIVYANPAFTAMTGYSQDEVIGRSPGILQGPKTDRAELQRLRDNLARGYPFHGRTVNYRKDGSEFRIEWKVLPVRNHQGTITHYASIQRAITDRR